jgi:hypothetical protein
MLQMLKMVYDIQSSGLLCVSGVTGSHIVNLSMSVAVDGISSV